MNDVNIQDRFAISNANSYVKIRYKVSVVNGPILKGAAEPEEMDFVTGYSHVIPGLERRLLGHGEGDRMGFTVPAEEAFGPRREELLIEKKKEDFHFPDWLKPYPGMEIAFVSVNDNAPETVIIREIREESIVVDCNHPLSGLNLKYDLEIIESRAAKSTDVCGEWELKPVEESCSCSPCEIVLGNPESKES